MVSAFETYLQNAFDGIEGWCDRKVFKPLEVMLETEVGLSGGRNGACEIGVHHGKFFIGLHNLLGGAPSLAVDVFGDQRLNLDGSGSGDRAQFEQHVAQHALRPANVHIKLCDSLALTAADVLDIEHSIGKFHIFSVDGGHTATHVVNDYRIAEQLTDPRGIILIDDFVHPHWPGVAEGVHRLYFSSEPRFVPVLFTGGKLFLVLLTYHRAYLSHLATHLRPVDGYSDLKDVRLFGHDMLASSW